MLHPLWATYVAVLAAEILGDKFLYTTGILSTRYRTFPMMIGIAVAFMAKMGVAVAVGDALAHLPRLVVAGVTASGMIAIAVSGAMSAPWLLGYIDAYLGVQFVMLIPAFGSVAVLTLALLLMLEARLMGAKRNRQSEPLIAGD